MNVITLSGNLCQDTELRYSVSGKPILNNTLAVRKDKKNSQGNYETDFIQIILFDHNAEFLNKYAKKGDKIMINGKMRVDRFQDKEGNYRTSNYVVVDRVELLSQKRDEKKGIQNLSDISEILIKDEDLPF